MLHVITYNEIDHEQWSTLVETSATGTWFQTPEAYDFFASMPELFLPFVVAIAKDSSLSEAQHSITPSLHEQVLRAVCVGYVTKEKNPIKQFFTRRAIVIGGPALADDTTDEEVAALLSVLKSTLLAGRDGVGSCPIYIETRNFNDYSRWRNAFETAGFSYQPHLNFHVDCTDAEAMWKRMSENRKRQIKKVSAVTPLNDAAKLPNDVPTELNDAVTEADIIEWYAILAELYRTKVKTPLWPVEFFLEAYRQGVGKYMLVRHEEKIIGGSMVVTDGKAVYEWFECGLNAEYKEQYPSVMATYTGMQYANAHHISLYDMMGAGEPNKPYGVRDFKVEFGGKLIEQGRSIHIAEPILYRIGAIGVGILKRI